MSGLNSHKEPAPQLQTPSFLSGPYPWLRNFHYFRITSKFLGCIPQNTDCGPSLLESLPWQVQSRFAKYKLISLEYTESWNVLYILLPLCLSVYYLPPPPQETLFSIWVFDNSLMWVYCPLHNTYFYYAHCDNKEDINWIHYSIPLAIISFILLR